MRQMAAANLICAQQPLRTGISRIVAHGRRERETRTEGKNSTDVPSARNLAQSSGLVQVRLAPADWGFIRDGRNPTLAVFKVGQPCSGRRLRAARRRGRFAENFRRVGYA